MKYEKIVKYLKKKLIKCEKFTENEQYIIIQQKFKKNVKLSGNIEF